MAAGKDSFPGTAFPAFPARVYAIGIGTSNKTVWVNVRVVSEALGIDARIGRLAPDSNPSTRGKGTEILPQNEPHPRYRYRQDTVRLQDDDGTWGSGCICSTVHGRHVERSDWNLEKGREVEAQEQEDGG